MPRRAARLGALAAAAVLSLSACGWSSPIRTQEMYAPSDGIRLDLATYGGIQSGALGPDGQRRSVFASLDDRGVPRLVAALWARHEEVAGRVDPAIRGMPLALPPLPAEEIQLVETWITQGRPQ